MAASADGHRHRALFRIAQGGDSVRGISAASDKRGSAIDGSVPDLAACLVVWVARMNQPAANVQRPNITHLFLLSES
jgi:hypothetical protein